MQLKETFERKHFLFTHLPISENKSPRFRLLHHGFFAKITVKYHRYACQLQNSVKKSRYNSEILPFCLLVQISSCYKVTAPTLTLPITIYEELSVRSDPVGTCPVLLAASDPDYLLQPCLGGHMDLFITLLIWEYKVQIYIVTGV